MRWWRFLFICKSLQRNNHLIHNLVKFLTIQSLTSRGLIWVLPLLDDPWVCPRLGFYHSASSFSTLPIPLASNKIICSSTRKNTVCHLIARVHPKGNWREVQRKLFSGISYQIKTKNFKLKFNSEITILSPTFISIRDNGNIIALGQKKRLRRLSNHRAMASEQSMKH